MFEYTMKVTHFTYDTTVIMLLNGIKFNWTWAACLANKG